MTDQPKILIVDDDADLVNVMRVILEGQACQVVSAASKAEGLEKVKTENPDLILLDVMMPEGTEGFHFVWELRNRFERPHCDIPILVLSSVHETTPLRFYPDESDGTYAPGEYLPVQDFADKPIDPDDLIARVKRLLKPRTPP
jgi:CheY-like chemotaxis protein